MKSLVGFIALGHRCRMRSGEMISVCALLVLGLKASDAVIDDYFDFAALFYQTYGPSGEYLFDYEGNEMFHVDLDSKSVVWTLPGLEKYTSFDPQGGLQNINVVKHNLDIVMKRSNFTATTNIAPLVNVYATKPVVLGEPNILICCVKNIFPPVMNTTWIKNGEKITDGYSKTSFLPAQDHSFRRLHYLAFIPNEHDIYTCEVEHWGLERPTRRVWKHDVPTPISEAYQNAICALGLAVGIIGIIAGVMLIIKGMKQSAAQGRDQR